MSLIGLPLSLEVLLLCSVIFFLSSLIYKLLINKEQIREVKAKQKEHQERVKELQKTNPEQANQAMNDMLKLSQKQMKITMKPMMVSLLIFILVLPILAGAYGDINVQLTDNSGVLTIDKTNYTLQLSGNQLSVGGTSYSLPSSDQQIGGYNWNIQAQDDRVTFSRIVAFLPFSLPLLGSDMGWFAWYFVLSLALTSIFRKVLGVEI